MANPVQAQFTATPLSGAALLTVTFSDQSQTAYETLSEWWWDFGDGTFGSDDVICQGILIQLLSASSSVNFRQGDPPVVGQVHHLS